MVNENFQDGYILLSRSIINSEIWKKPPEYLKIFLFILVKVNHKDGLFPRGSNFFNFSDQKPDGVTLNQIYKFLSWAKSKKVQILATQKSTRGVVIKVNNYGAYQTPNNYYRQDTWQDSGRTAAGQRQDSGRTINKNERMKECNNLSLSNDGVNQKRLGKREREILKSYCKRNKVLNSNAYIRKLIDTGDYQSILEEEINRLEKIEAKKKQVQQVETLINPSSPQEMEKAMQNAKNVIQMIRRRG